MATGLVIGPDERRVPGAHAAVGGCCGICGSPCPCSGARHNWIVEEVVTVTGRAAAVGFRLGDGVVEVWRGRSVCAVFDRDRLREWLAGLPAAVLRCGGVALSVDRALDDRGRVAITMDDVQAWSLSPWTHDLLRRRV